MDLKKNISLIIGISIPVFMVILIAASIYLPSFFAPAPQFNFLYVMGDSCGSDFQFTVENDMLVKHEVKCPKGRMPKDVRLFIHDVIKNADREIAFEEAQKLKLDPMLESPDGYEVVYGSDHWGYFPFFYDGSNYDAMYLKGHNTNRKLKLQLSSDGRYYYRNRRFLGWLR